MTATKSIELETCPNILQEAVRKKREFAEQYRYPFTILSVALRESTPYFDKTKVVRTYRVFLSYANIISILECAGDDVLKHKLIENSLLWGDIIEILRHPPAGSGLDEIRQAVLSSNSAWHLN